MIERTFGMRLGLTRLDGNWQLVEIGGPDNDLTVTPWLGAQIDPATGVVPFLQQPDLLAGLSRGPSGPLDPAALMAPVPRPPRVFGIALNYRDHAAETGRPVPTVQTWFMKQTTSVNAPFGTIAKPAVSDMLDFEAELVAVIGRTCRRVPADRAHAVIAGYATGCDITVRDWQRATPTMNMGKGWDTHAPFGPWLTSARAVDAGGGLGHRAVRCSINGATMQDGVAGDMVFSIAEQIAHLSTAMTLLPGDVIYTGTPAGVGIARTPPVFLSVGDVVRCEVAGLGAIENVVVADSVEMIMD
jgi:2-keto-4-pentenoate hydratase/2-oxohepta-3-ene-1,7-dioic acid hydratase in catechol pathway